jgi:hypothetical protein
LNEFADTPSGLERYLPRVHAARGGDVWRRWVMIAAALAEALDQRIGSVAESPPTIADLLGDTVPVTRVSSADGTAAGLRAWFRGQGGPEPEIWPGLRALSEGDDVVFVRSLARSVVLAWAPARVSASDRPESGAGKGGEESSSRDPNDLALLFSCCQIPSHLVPIGCDVYGVVLDRHLFRPPISGVRSRARLVEVSLVA